MHVWLWASRCLAKARWLESRTRWELLYERFGAKRSQMLLCVHTDDLVSDTSQVHKNPFPLFLSSILYSSQQ